MSVKLHKSFKKAEQLRSTVKAKPPYSSSACEPLRRGKPGGRAEGRQLCYRLFPA